MWERATRRSGSIVVVAIALLSFGWPPSGALAAPDLAGVTPAGRPGQLLVRAGSFTAAEPSGLLPALGQQFSFSTGTTVTKSGPAAPGGAARSPAQGVLQGSSSGSQPFVMPQPVTQLASLVGATGGVVSVAGGEFSSSGHQDVAAVICNPCGAWANPPWPPAAQGQYSIAVLPGNGDGTFGAPTQLSPVGPNVALDMIVAADLGNGHADLVVSEDDPAATNPYQLLVYLGNGDGTFSSTPIALVAPGPIVRFQVADLGDGHPDIVALVQGASGNEVVLFTGDGTGHFGAGTPIPLCSSGASGCPGSDSVTDLVVAPLATGGQPDILVSQDSGYALNNGYESSTDTLAVLVNNGNGTFQSPAYPVTDMSATQGIEVGDFTGASGPPDVLIVGSCSGAISATNNCQEILLGNGDGTFQAPLSKDSSAVEPDSMRAAVADTPISLAGNGVPDALWLTTYGNNQSQVVEAMIDDGQGGFTRQELVGALPGGVYASTALPVDLTGSGQPDLVVGGGPIGSQSASPGLWVVPANPKTPGTFLTAQGYLPDPPYTQNNPTGITLTQYDQSVTVGDFENNGNQDVVSVGADNAGGTEVTLLPGNGDGTFGPPQSRGYPVASGNTSLFPRWGLVSGNFSGNGKLDIAYLDNNGGLDYQMGNGDGTFGSVVQVAPSPVVGGGHSQADLVLTSLNGEPDVIASVLVTSTQQYLESWLWNPATSSFGAPVVSGPLPALSSGDVAVAVGHLKAGDPLDLVTVVQPSGGNPEVDMEPGNADGSFDTASPTQIAAPCASAGGGAGYGAVAVGDLGNGHDDVVWQCTSTLNVAFGDGTGAFPSTATFSEPDVGNDAHLLLADLEGNGRLDAVAWGGDSPSSGMAVWHNNGDGTFAPAQLVSTGIPVNQNLGELITAAPLTSQGTDDLLVLGAPGDGDTDELTVLLASGGRPSLETTLVSAPSPATPAPGDIVTGSYQVTDTGSAASGSWVDSVYLAPGATGSTWTTADTLLGRVPQTQTLAGGGSYSGGFSFPLGDVPAGTYHLVVVPDSGDVLSGGNETAGASSAFSVGPVPTLTVGSPVATTVEAGQTLYYQVAVTVGTDVQVALTGLPSGAGVTMLGENGQVPSATTATVASASTTLSLPGSSPGTWFVAIEPSPSVGTSAVPITVSASNLGFVLDAVTPASHSIPQMPSNACTPLAFPKVICPPPPPPPPLGDGMMTLTLQGSGFGADLAVQLVDGSTTYTATTVTRRDSTVAFASFPVASATSELVPPARQVQPGTYDVVVSSAGHTVTLPKAFTVAVGPVYVPPPSTAQTPTVPLSVSFSAPSALRQGWVGQVSVTLHNNTSTDLAVPVVDLSSPNALLGGPGVTDVVDFQSALELDDLVYSTDPLADPSPPGVLAAGQSYTLDLSILNNTGIEHSFLETDASVLNSGDPSPIYWYDLLSSYQPPGMTAADWGNVVGDFAKRFGTTNGTFASSLVQTFAQAKQYGVTLASEADAILFMVNEELAAYPGAWVNGTLYLNSTSQPLANVNLELVDPSTSSVVATTTSWYDGRFAFYGVTSGSYELVAPGWLPDPLQALRVPSQSQGLSIVVNGGAPLTGTVTQTDGVTPVVGAVVTAVDSSGATIASNTTGSDGSYTISGLAAGPVTVSAGAPGYETAPDQTATVSDSGPTTLNLQLQQDGTISGSITLPGGGTPTGASVDAQAVSGGPVEQGSVNADGTYSIQAPPGSYTVVAEASGDGPAQDTPVIVTAGTATSGVNLQLSGSAASVTGVVTDADTGAPIAGATIATDAANGADGPVTTASDGSYTLSGLPTGPVAISVFPPDASHLATQVSFTATAGPAVTENVSLDPAGTATATITEGDGTTPLAGATVQVVGPSPGSATDPEQHQTLTTDANGMATLGGLPPGAYDLAVVGSTAHQAFTIAAGARNATISLSVPTGTVSGQVLDSSGNPVAGATVDLDDTTGPVASTQTDANGNYSFTVTAAGTMDVVATGSQIGTLVQGGVAVATGRSTTVAPMQAGAGSLSVTVTSGGVPVAAASVVLQSGATSDQTAWVSASTSSSGTAVIDNLTAGTYQLQVSDGTDATDVQSVTLSANANVLDVAMQPGGSITGVVTDSTASPVTGASISAVSQSSGLVVDASTAADGSYDIAGLPPGGYSLSVSASGDAPSDIDGVTVSAGAATAENASLSSTGSSLTVSLVPGGAGPLPALNAVLEDSTGTPVATEALGPAVSASDAAAEATFSPLSPGNYTLVVSGPGSTTATQAVVVTTGANTATVTVPALEVLAPSSPASVQGPVAGQSKAGTQLVPTAHVVPATGGAVARGAAAALSNPTAQGVPAASWLSQWYYSGKWTSVVPDPNSYQHQPGYEPLLALEQSLGISPSPYDWLSELQAEIATASQSYQGLCNNPYLAKASLYAQLAQQALNHWQADYDIVQREAAANDLEIGRQTAFLVAAIALIVAAGAAAGPAAKLLGSFGASGATVAAIGGVGSSALELLDGWVNSSGPPDLNSQISTLNNWESIFTTASGELSKLGPQATNVVSLGKTVGTVGGWLTTTLNAITSAISLAQALQQSTATLRAAADDAAAAEGNFWNYLSYAAAAADYPYQCPPKPQPNPPLPQPVPEYPYHLPRNVLPGDPNEILGTIGDGSAAQYVDPGSTLSYTIFFKNEPTASAPATKVVVTMPLPAGTDPSTLQLTGFGFGQTSVPLSGNVTSFSRLLTGLNLADGDNVSASGTYDAGTNTITWTLEAINPLTGDVDGTPQGGFLPPDNAAGDGEGFVSFQVDAEPGLASGTAINAQASIVFDTNAAISTNTWVNTVDASAPTATVASLPATESGPFTVSWSGSAPASQIATYNVYVSTDSGPWTLWQSAVTGTSAEYPGEGGHAYQFAATATDLLGNTGPIPADAQASTTVEVPSGGSTPPPTTTTTAPSGGSTPPPTTTVPPPRAPARAPKVSLRSRHLAFLAGHLRITLGCARAGCRGTLRLEQRVVRTIGHGKRARHKVSWRVLGTARIVLAAGRTRTLRLALDASGRSILAKAGKRHVLHLEALVTLGKASHRIVVTVS